MDAYLLHLVLYSTLGTLILPVGRLQNIFENVEIIENHWQPL